MLVLEELAVLFRREIGIARNLDVQCRLQQRRPFWLAGSAQASAPRHRSGSVASGSVRTVGADTPKTGAIRGRRRTAPSV